MERRLGAAAAKVLRREGLLLVIQKLMGADIRTKHLVAKLGELRTDLAGFILPVATVRPGFRSGGRDVAFLARTNLPGRGRQLR